MKLVAALVVVLAGGAAAQPSGSPRSEIQVLNDTLVRLTEKMAPSVVQVTSDGFALTGEGPAAGAVSRQSTGSGVVISPEGHIVTNAHVVRGAMRLQVTLAPERSEEYQSILRPRGRTVAAKLLGFDEETDLAVLKVDSVKLPAAVLADSDRVRQGQIVLALGNPFGLDNSVSMGVVSAVARQLEADSPVIYLQTDASINPGNSGGPMVDVDGKVIGINAMIFSRSGGSEGIGFAVPVNIVRYVADQIISKGSVTRGEIGIEAQTITPALGRAFGLERSYGVIIADVVPGGPAQLSGVRAGDIVLSMNGKRMENARQLQVNLYGQPIRSTVELELLRGKVVVKKTVAVMERDDDPARFAGLIDRQTGTVSKLGFIGLPVDVKLRILVPSLRTGKGVLVAAPLASASGPAGAFLPGDVISAVNTKSVGNTEELREALTPFAAGETVVIQLERAGRMRFLEVTVD
jgi:serine protease Do